MKKQVLKRISYYTTADIGDVGMKKQLLIFVMIIMMVTIFYSGCVEEEELKPKLEMSFDTDSSEFPVELIVTSVDSDRTYDWNEVNITLTSQYIEPIFLSKNGGINISDVIEIPYSVFDELSKIFVRIRLNTSSLLIWDSIVYPPVTKPNVTFSIDGNKLVVESVDKVDFDWDFNLTMSNDTITITDQIFKKYKTIEVGDIIDLNIYEYYGDGF